MWQRLKILMITALAPVLALANGWAWEIPAEPGAFSCPASNLSLPKDQAEVTRRLMVIQSGNRLGTGVIVSEDGYALTAAHVTGNAATVAAFHVGGESYTAQVVKRDWVYDIALIKLPAQKLPCLPVAGKQDLRGGLFIAGLNPLDMQPLLLEARHPERSDTAAPLQVRGNLPSGSSGSPFLNERGELLGIVSLKQTTRNATRILGAPLNLSHIAEGVRVI